MSNLLPFTIILKDNSNFLQWQHFIKAVLLSKKLWNIINYIETKLTDLVIGHLTPQQVEKHISHQQDFDQHSDCVLGCIAFNRPFITWVHGQCRQSSHYLYSNLCTLSTKSTYMSLLTLQLLLLDQNRRKSIPTSTLQCHQLHCSTANCL